MASKLSWISNWYLPILAVATVGVGGVAVAKSIGIAHLGPTGEPLPKAQLLSVSPVEAIGANASFESDANAPYTLVEFMDYQCPPCHFAYEHLPEMLARFPGKVRFAVRQFPLSMHPDAYPAAVAAEAARNQGKFWPMHHALFASATLDQGTLFNIARAQNLDIAKFTHDIKGNARDRVKADQAAAPQLHLDGTPTFYLCAPDSKVWKLADINQLVDLVK